MYLLKRPNGVSQCCILTVVAFSTSVQYFLVQCEEEESHTIVSSKDLKDPMLAPTIKVDDVVEINYKEKDDTVAYKGSVIALGKLHISMHC